MERDLREKLQALDQANFNLDQVNHMFPDNNSVKSGAAAKVQLSITNLNRILNEDEKSPNLGKEKEPH